MHKLVLIADSVGIATMYALLGHVEPIEETARNATRAECTQFPSIVVRFPIFTLLRTTIQATPLSEFTIGFVVRKPPPPLPPGKAQSTVKGHGKFVLGLMTPLYVDFFERHREWMEETFPTQKDQWPPLFFFAFMLRNFISHSAGRVQFSYDESPPISWHALNYSPADKGREILGADIDIGDLIVLLFELSDELDRLGCPINL
jgi:hypothetical protein